MAKEYTVTRGRRAANRLMAMLVRRGKSASWILSTTGRTTGERRSVVVTPVEVDGTMYLVAPYGAVAWVKNVRANPQVTLSKGDTTMRVHTLEVDRDEAGPVLLSYHKQNATYVGDYMDIPGDGTLTDFVAVAEHYPVFRTESIS